jgi:hypothetical protein
MLMQNKKNINTSLATKKNSASKFNYLFSFILFNRHQSNYCFNRKEAKDIKGLFGA